MRKVIRKLVIKIISIVSMILNHNPQKIRKIFPRCRYYSIPRSYSSCRNIEITFSLIILQMNRSNIEKNIRKILKKDSVTPYYFPKFNYRLQLDRFTEQETRNFFPRINVRPCFKGRLFSPVDAHRNDRKFQLAGWWVAITNAFDEKESKSIVC